MLKLTRWCLYIKKTKCFFVFFSSSLCLFFCVFFFFWVFSACFLCFCLSVLIDLLALSRLLRRRRLLASLLHLRLVLLRHGLARLLLARGRCGRRRLVRRCGCRGSGLLRRGLLLARRLLLLRERLARLLLARRSTCCRRLAGLSGRLLLSGLLLATRRHLREMLRAEDLLGLRLACLSAGGCSSCRKLGAHGLQRSRSLRDALLEGGEFDHLVARHLDVELRVCVCDCCNILKRGTNNWWGNPFQFLFQIEVDFMVKRLRGFNFYSRLKKLVWRGEGGLRRVL